MTDRKPDRKTLRLGPPPDPPSERWEPTDHAMTIQTPGAGAAPAPPVANRGAGRTVELLVVDETQLPGGERRPWRAAEVWTKRRVYGLDSTFKCIEVLDRATGRPHANHDMLGARLGGGRHRFFDTVRFSYPLPLPGMEAMFVKDKKYGYTSPVERMIVRIRVLHTSADEQPPTWEEVASRWTEPPPRS